MLNQTKGLTIYMNEEFLKQLEDWQHRLRNFMCLLGDMIEQEKYRLLAKKAEMEKGTDNAQ